MLSSNDDDDDDNNGDHGIRWADTLQALAWWRRLGASHEATDMLHWLMCFVPCTVCTLCGARQCGTQSNIVNLFLKVFLYENLHMTSLRTATAPQQLPKTPRPWWPSRSPLQWRGVDGPTRSSVRATCPWFWLRSRMKNYGSKALIIVVINIFRSTPLVLI